MGKPVRSAAHPGLGDSSIYSINYLGCLEFEIGQKSVVFSGLISLCYSCFARLHQSRHIPGSLSQLCSVSQQKIWEQKGSVTEQIIGMALAGPFCKYSRGKCSAKGSLAGKQVNNFLSFRDFYAIEY